MPTVDDEQYEKLLDYTVKTGIACFRMASRRTSLLHTEANTAAIDKAQRAALAADSIGGAVDSLIKSQRSTCLAYQAAPDPSTSPAREIGLHWAAITAPALSARLKILDTSDDAGVMLLQHMIEPELHACEFSVLLMGLADTQTRRAATKG